MTPEELAILKEEIKDEIISKLGLSLNFQGDNYGGFGGHLSVTLLYDGNSVAYESVYIS